MREEEHTGIGWMSLLSSSLPSSFTHSLYYSYGLSHKQKARQVARTQVQVCCWDLCTARIYFPWSFFVNMPVKYIIHRMVAGLGCAFVFTLESGSSLFSSEMKSHCAAYSSVYVRQKVPDFHKLFYSTATCIYLFTWVVSSERSSGTCGPDGSGDFVELKSTACVFLVGKHAYDQHRSSWIKTRSSSWLYSRERRREEAGRSVNPFASTFFFFSWRWGTLDGVEIVPLEQLEECKTHLLCLSPLPRSLMFPLPSSVVHHLPPHAHTHAGYSPYVRTHCLPLPWIPFSWS